MPELTVTTYLNRDQHIDPFLGIGASDTTKDGALDMFNKAAKTRLDEILNVDSLERATYTAERFEDGGSKIRTRNFPVISVSSITYGRDDMAYTQTEDYIIPAEKRNVILLDGVLPAGKGYAASKVTYVAGYITYDQNAYSGGSYEGLGETFPEDLKLALLFLIAGWMNEKNNAQVKTYSIQGKTVTLRDDVEARQFESIIKKYMKPAVYVV